MQKKTIEDIIILEDMLNENKDKMQQDQITAFNHAIRALRFEDCIQKIKHFIKTTKKPITQKIVLQYLESCDKTAKILVDKPHRWILINNKNKEVKCPICWYHIFYDEKNPALYCKRCGTRMTGIDGIDLLYKNIKLTLTDAEGNFIYD